MSEVNWRRGKVKGQKGLFKLFGMMFNHLNNISYILCFFIGVLSKNSMCKCIGKDFWAYL